MDPTQNKIVLLVECEGYWITVLRQMLREKGFGVFCAHNGLEAITLCTKLQLHPDLLISSIHLPKMNGIDLAQWFRLRQPSIRILLLAEYSDLLPSDPDCYGKELKIVRRPGTKESFWETIQELVPRSLNHVEV